MGAAWFVLMLYAYQHENRRGCRAILLAGVTDRSVWWTGSNPCQQDEKCRFPNGFQHKCLSTLDTVLYLVLK